MGAGVGLVLRSHMVEVVEARRTLTGVRVTKHARLPIANLQDDAKVVEAIQTALASAGISATRMGVTVPAQDVLLRSFTLPHLPRAEWPTAVQFEARKYIPFKIEELVWDFHATEDEQTKQISAVFVGMRLEVFERIRKWLNEAGVEPLWIEAPWFSLARIAAEAVKKVAPGECLGIVDVEADAVHVVIVKNQIPYLGRDVNLAAIGSGPSVGDPASSAQTQKLLSELRLSFDFFTREHPTALINRVVLIGDPQVVGPWCEWLAPQLHCPVEVARLPAQAREAVELSFALALGVARRQVGLGAARLDFVQRSLPQAVSVKSKLLENLFAATQLDVDFIRSMAKPALTQTALAAAALGLFLLLSQQQVSAMRRQLARMAQSQPDLGWGLAGKPGADLQTLKPEVEKRLAFLDRVILQRVSVAQKLEVLARALPDGIWLEGLTYQDQLLEKSDKNKTSLNLRGACYLPERGKELGAISDLTQRIKRDPDFFRGFTSAQLGQIAQAEDALKQYTYQTFQVTCSADPLGRL